MKKITLLLTGSLLCTTLLSQIVFTDQVVIANGGLYEFSPPYNDRATIGMYDLGQGSYSVIDTIEVESVQDVSVYHAGFGAPRFYVAAEDSVVAYGGLPIVRTGQIYFPNIRSVTVTPNYVVAGRWFGTGDYVGVYDPVSMTPIYSISDTFISNTVYSAVEVADSIYVSFNLPGTIDNCPPYGCYDDSLGRIGVIDMTFGNYVRTIELGSAAAGVRELMKYNGKIYLACEVSGNLIEYDPATASTSVNSLNIIKSYGFDQVHYGTMNESILTAYRSGSVSTYSLVSSADLPVQAPVYPVAAITDMNSGYIFHTQTDYASYGRLYIENGTNLDSVEVGISPEALGVIYSTASSVLEYEGTVAVYPNPSNGSFYTGELKGNFSIYSIDGKILHSGYTYPGKQIRTALSQGAYILKIQSDEKLYTGRIVIR